MKAEGYLVTGTDTGVGKTLVTAALALVSAKEGVPAGVMKPVETGCRRRADASLVPADAVFLAGTAGVDDGLDLVCPERFAAPLAPWTAARLERRRVSLARIRKAYGRLAARYARVLVEGAGGVAVPLSRDYLFSNLALELGLTAVVVARPALGTINHTVLTLEHLLRRGVPVAGVIFSKASPGGRDQAAETSPGVIEALTGVRILGTLGFLKAVDPRSLLRAAEGLIRPWDKRERAAATDVT